MNLSVDIYGLFDVPCGLRVAADSTYELFKNKGVDVRRVAVDPRGRLRRDFEERRIPQINLFHINPDLLNLVVMRNGTRRLNASSALNVCTPFWELPILPRTWLGPLSRLDLVLAPTRFVRDAVVAAVPNVVTELFPQVARLPGPIAPDRERYRFQRGQVVFVVSFAVQSVVERKNPRAAIRAFQRAFPSRNDVCLVVRIHSIVPNGEQRVAREILRLAGSDTRIRVLTGDMGYEDVLTLYASADVYVSLHRSEGLGLGPMEAMSLGKPVVATGWSGNLDFMTDENSVLVDYSLVPVDVGKDNPYARDALAAEAMWAEPDEAAAAASFRQLADNAELRAALGARAQRDMAACLRTYEKGLVLEVLSEAHDRLQALGSERDATMGEWRKARRQVVMVRYVKRPVVKALRAVGLKSNA